MVLYEYWYVHVLADDTQVRIHRREYISPSVKPHTLVAKIDGSPSGRSVQVGSMLLMVPPCSDANNIVGHSVYRTF